MIRMGLLIWSFFTFSDAAIFWDEHFSEARTCGGEHLPFCAALFLMDPSRSIKRGLFGAPILAKHAPFPSAHPQATRARPSVLTWMSNCQCLNTFSQFGSKKGSIMHAFIHSAAAACILACATWPQVYLSLLHLPESVCFLGRKRRGGGGPQHYIYLASTLHLFGLIFCLDQRWKRKEIRKTTKRRKGKKEERQRTCVKRRGCSPGAAARQSGYLCISIRTSESCRGVQLSYLCDRGISQNLIIAVMFLSRCFLLLIFCFFKQKCAGKPAHICCWYDTTKTFSKPRKQKGAYVNKRKKKEVQGEHPKMVFPGPEVNLNGVKI